MKLSSLSALTAAHTQAEQGQRAHQQYIALEKRRDTRKQADLDAGRLVRIRLEYPGEEPITGLYLPRVAAFICQVLGEPQRSAKGGVRFTITTRGQMNAAYYPEAQAGRATMALLAHARAVTKMERRRR